MEDNNDNKWNRDELVKLYEITETNRRDYSDRQWKTLKLTTTVVSFILPMTFYALKYFQDSLEFSPALFLIPSVGYIVSNVCYINLYRETKLLYEQIGILISLRRFLNFDRVISDDGRFFKKQRTLFPEGYFEEFDTNEDFVKNRLKNSKSLRIFKIIFMLYTFVTGILTVLIFAISFRGYSYLHIFVYSAIVLFAMVFISSRVFSLGMVNNWEKTKDRNQRH